MICIFRYGKSKEAFGWPEESEDIPAEQSTPSQLPDSSTTNNYSENFPDLSNLSTFIDK